MTLDKILQVGIITADVEKSVEEFKKFGLTKWTVMPFEPHMIPGMTINGQPGGPFVLREPCTARAIWKLN